MNTIKIMKDGRPATHSELCKAAGIPQHTPGPWRINGGVVGVEEIFHAKNEEEARGVCVVGKIGNQSEKDTANARLIAAAPEMLQALLDVERAYQDMFDIMPVAWQTFDDLVTAAINKATGA